MTKTHFPTKDITLEGVAVFLAPLVLALLIVSFLGTSVEKKSTPSVTIDDAHVVISRRAP